MGFECPTLVLEITDRNHEATRTRTKMHPRWSGRSTVSAGAKIRNKLVKPFKTEITCKTGKPGLKINFNCSENKVYSQNCEAMQRRNLEKN